MKIALRIAYDGTDFHGFARQRTARTVQGVLEERLALLLRAPVATTCAGRTDAGVHAAGQIVTGEVPDGTDPGWVMARLNRWLAPEVSVAAAAAVPADFDARRSARRRVYEYRCYAGPAPDPFRDRFALHLVERPAIAPMRAAARPLVGEHDFAAFCRKGQVPTLRRIRSIGVRPSGDSVAFRLVADAFCQQMVRAIVGTLLDVGSGRRAPADVARALSSGDRSAAGAVAHPRGLHLVRVAYPRDPFGGR